MSSKGVFLSLSSLSAIAAAVTLTVAPKTAAACAESGSIYIGTVCMTAANYCPDGYVEAQGQLLQINQYNALYSLVGTTYGGDARNTFGIPDYRGRSPVGLGTGPGLTVVQFGEKRGVETVTLTQAQMPAHTHTATFVPATSGTGPTQKITVGPFSGTGLTISGLNVTATPNNLTATTKGTVTLANNVGNGTNTPAAGNVFTSAGTGAKVYAAATGSDFALGGTQTFTGPVTGTISTSVTGGTVSGTPTIPQFSFDVPTGGSVTNANAGSSQPATNIPPQQAIRTCVALNGLYPPRP